MNNNSTQSKCNEIENILNSTFGHFLLYGQLPLLFATLIFIGILIFQYFKHKILIHGNLMLLFVNIVFIYFIAIFGQFSWLLRYRILLFFYTDPCQLMTPLWMVALFYGPTNAQSIAYPALHFCVMIERVRATFLAAKYEKEGKWLGIWMVVIIWIFSGAYLAFILIAAFSVPEMALQGMPYLTSAYSSMTSLIANIVALLVVIFTALCDWRITLLNKRIRAQSKNYANYSLAKNFQLNENSLAMRLILPMDIAYALLYSIYSICVILIRLNRFTMSTMEYSFYYNLINTLLYIYAAITMIVYIRFLKFMGKNKRRNVQPKSRGGEEEAKVHFGQLKLQWQIP